MRRRTALAGLLSVYAIRPGKALAENGPIAVSGDRFRIGDEPFQLSDVIAPSQYSLHQSSEPFFEGALRGMETALSDHQFNLSPSGPMTRWGAQRVLARRKEDGLSLQEILVSRGAVRVAPETESDSLIDHLLGVETVARAQKRGLWARDAYSVHNADDAWDAIGAFHLIEGRVQQARAAKARFYLNFGDDYRRDFTASAQMRRVRRWQKSGIELAALNGKRIRVRGFVNQINGPAITLNHSRQIEVLA